MRLGHRYFRGSFVSKIQAAAASFAARRTGKERLRKLTKNDFPLLAQSCGALHWRYLRFGGPNGRLHAATKHALTAYTETVDPRSWVP